MHRCWRPVLDAAPEAPRLRSKIHAELSKNGIDYGFTMDLLWIYSEIARSLRKLMTICDACRDSAVAKCCPADLLHGSFQCLVFKKPRTNLTPEETKAII